MRRGKSAVGPLGTHIHHPSCTCDPSPPPLCPAAEEGPLCPAALARLGAEVPLVSADRLA